MKLAEEDTQSFNLNQTENDLRNSNLNQNSGQKIPEDDDNIFEDISGETKSKVWEHFLLNRNACLVKCVHCSMLLTYKENFGTSGMHSHLKSQHSIIVNKLDLTTDVKPAELYNLRQNELIESNANLNQNSEQNSAEMYT